MKSVNTELGGSSLAGKSVLNPYLIGDIYTHTKLNLYFVRISILPNSSYLALIKKTEVSYESAFIQFSFGNCNF